MLTGLLQEVADACGGSLHGADLRFEGVCSDTRSLEAGNLFVALQGPRFDGNHFLAEAAAAGAVAALSCLPGSEHLPLVEVADTLRGLQDLGRLARSRFEGRVVGITGSNGKTTVKELTAACLRTRGPTLSTRGNYNNHIGVPLTLCRLGPEYDFAVIEMGAGGLREIEPLAEMSRAHVAVLTCCAPAHLEGFGSLEGVARTKGEIYQALPADGVAILNGEDAWAPYWRELIGERRTLTFGMQPHFDVHARNPVLSAEGSCFDLVLPGSRATVKLPLLGRHNILNALAASAAACALGLDAAACANGLASVEPVSGRLQRLQRRDGGVLINDTYNANPASLESAARTACATSPRVWLVLGDMAELGREAVTLHHEAGHTLHEAGIERLFTIGPLSAETSRGFGAGASHHLSLDDLAAHIESGITSDVLLLVKGSRSAGLERIVHLLSRRD
jgi:UDP-N-acetylmuramoyl-tripeptide--D-alanyl-D-alanine ligase